MDAFDRVEEASNPSAESGPAAPAAAAEAEEEELVVQGNMAAAVEKFYTKPDGSKTLLFWLALAIGPLNGVQWMFFSPLIPSVVQALEAGDTLMVMGVTIWSLMFYVPFGLWMRETRHTLRGRETPYRDSGKSGHLFRIGVGREPIRKSVADNINWHHSMMKQAMNPLPFWLPFGYIIYTGGGAQAALWNRLAGFILVLAFTVNRPMLVPGMFSMRMACATASAKVEKIAKAVQSRPTGDAEWQEQVTRPLQELMDTMDALSEGFAGLISTFSLGVCPLMVFSSVCILLSPMTDTLDYGGPRTATFVRAFFALFAILFTWGPFLLASGVAGVSTACDDLKEALNKLRVATLDQEMHDRVTILEAAMANVRCLPFFDSPRRR